MFLGGVEIPCRLGLLGHSDADVLLHAVCDALLGAMGKTDIGELFPDTEAKYKNIKSDELLKSVCLILKKERFAVENIDAIVIAEEPKLGPFKKAIAGNIAGLLGLSLDQVNIKAKTNEGLDAVGQKQAIMAYATVLIARED